MLEKYKVIDEKISELQNLIRSRVNFITNDCYTFIYVRSKNLHKEWNTGGGNFLIVVGLFSLLNFLAKVYSNLTDLKSFYSKSDRDTVQNLINKLSPEYKKIAKDPNTKWCIPKIGNSVNEEKAFCKFVEVLRNSNIDLGIKSSVDAKQIWKYYRNKLSHMADPGPTMIGTHIKYEIKRKTDRKREIEKILEKYPAFKIDGSSILCDADKLIVLLREKVSPWICRQLEVLPIINIEVTLEWINEQYN